MIQDSIFMLPAEVFYGDLVVSLTSTVDYE